MKFLLPIIFLFVVAPSSAQDFSKYREKEEEVPKINRIKCDTVPVLADSIFNSLHTKKFKDIEIYTPSLEDLLATYDTLDIEGTLKMVRVKHNYMVFNLKKQHAVLVKSSKAYRLNLRTMTLFDRSIRYKTTDDGHHYAEVIYLVKKGKRQYVISFLAIKLIDTWYIGDHLKVQLL